MWLWITAALAADPTWAGTCGDVDRFEVLAFDLDQRVVAFKNVVSAAPAFDPDAAPPPVCAYAGMSATPHSGVELGVWDLDAGRVAELFTVYAVAETAAECTKHADSERALKAAKKRFAALGLDIGEPPTPAVPTESGVLTLGAVALRIDATKPTSQEDGMYWAREHRISAGDAVLHRDRISYTGMMAGYHQVQYPAWFAASGRAFAVVQHRIGNMRGSETCHTFTPALTLP